MIAPRPSARTPGRDLSPIAQRRQQMTDSPIARLYLGCPPWRSNAQEELPMSTPIQFRPVMIDVHPDDIAVAPELQVRHLRIPGNHRSRDAAQAALKDLLEWPQARAERAAYVCRGALVAFGAVAIAQRPPLKTRGRLRPGLWRLVRSGLRREADKSAGLGDTG